MNVSTPNILPGNASEGIFIAPQASTPVTGSAWGLLLEYSCTPIRNLHDFTILNQRMNSTDPGYIHSYYSADDDDISIINYYYDVANFSSINVLSEQGLDELLIQWVNIQAVAEIGISQGFERVQLSDVLGYDSSRNRYWEPYQGMSDVDVMEILLWQSVVFTDSSRLNVTAVKDPILGLEREHLDFAKKGMSAIGSDVPLLSRLGLRR